jgi:hypothetical protein
MNEIIVFHTRITFKQVSSKIKSIVVCLVEKDLTIPSPRIKGLTPKIFLPFTMEIPLIYVIWRQNHHGKMKDMVEDMDS